MFPPLTRACYGPAECSEQHLVSSFANAEWPRSCSPEVRAGSQLTEINEDEYAAFGEKIEPGLAPTDASTTIVPASTKAKAEVDEKIRAYKRATIRKNNYYY